MASPHVAAVAALLKAHQPSLTPDQIKSDLEKPAVDLARRASTTTTGAGVSTRSPP
jgi:serine protease